MLQCYFDFLVQLLAEKLEGRQGAEFPDLKLLDMGEKLLLRRKVFSETVVLNFMRLLGYFLRIKADEFQARVATLFLLKAMFMVCSEALLEPAGVLPQRGGGVRQQGLQEPAAHGQALRQDQEGPHDPAEE